LCLVTEVPSRWSPWKSSSLGRPEMTSSGPCGIWSHEPWGRDHREAGSVAFCIGLRSCCRVTLSKLCSGSSPNLGLIQHVNRPRPVLDTSVSVWSSRQAVLALCPVSFLQASCPSRAPRSPSPASLSPPGL